MNNDIEMLESKYTSCSNICRCNILNNILKDDPKKFAQNFLKLYMCRIFYGTCPINVTVDIITTLIENKYDLDHPHLEKIIALFQNDTFGKTMETGTILRKIKFAYGYDFVDFVKYLESSSSKLGCMTLKTAGFFVDEVEGREIVPLMFGRFYRDYICEDVDHYKLSNRVRHDNPDDIYNNMNSVVMKVFSKRAVYGGRDFLKVLGLCDRSGLCWILDYVNVVDSEFLEKICLGLDCGMIEDVLKLGVEVTSKCFVQVVSRGKDRMNERDEANTARIIDVFVKYGYEITYADVMMALVNRYYVNNIERFGINLDEHITEVCIKRDFYPYKGVKKPSIERLREECNKPNNSRVIRGIMSLGVNPDMECLENVCKCTGYVVVLRAMYREGLRCNLQCLRNYAEYNDVRVLKIMRIGNMEILMAHAVNTKAIMLKEILKFLNEDDKDFGEEDDEEDEPRGARSAQRRSRLLEDNTDSSGEATERSEPFGDDEYSEDETPVKKFKIGRRKKNIDEESDDEYSDEIPVGKNIFKIERRKNNIDEDSDDEYTGVNIFEVEKLQNERKKLLDATPIPIKTPKVEKKDLPSKDFIRVFSPNVNLERTKEVTLILAAKSMFEIKHSHVSLLELQRLFLKYVYEYDLNDNMRIRVNSSLSEILDVKRNSYIHFDDLNNIISYFIKNEKPVVKN